MKTIKRNLFLVKNIFNTKLAIETFAWVVVIWFVLFIAERNNFLLQFHTNSDSSSWLREDNVSRYVLSMTNLLANLPAQHDESINTRKKKRREWTVKKERKIEFDPLQFDFIAKGHWHCFWYFLRWCSASFLLSFLWPMHTWIFKWAALKQNVEIL